ncbi:2-octaprenyl-6-methoxyphenyl hydroxylase [Kushneria indalinina]|uniref:2-octaprenyl-6-methoxyphenol hydroxylase /2-octaprenyl-3-methyl-6-methoxy-1,4-benzoquinol hydroxylase n=1 Tax=Kushneria indalinina DSM 14324 TaxID=1122140 RepID=A0A3D9DTJ8_9GAMM|nr:2-octaprenyl-6-methoxyphenyl hydroxylase [Kushneria indalinina]REC93749.1 2-octaprenyl-6-methoxyphenol hydroxylase /2-octaprenyl-3-methyl-6-methoxy-1,4-benzoquinol hydroxylase [Kushneria indalinina DSM 14324]
MSETPVDIAIIGGGLVGASLAVALAPLIERHRLRVAVIEASELGATGAQPSFDERSSAIAYGSRAHFEALGIWSELATRAAPIHDIEVSQRGAMGRTHLSSRDVGTPSLGYVLPNAFLGQVLHERLSHMSIDWHCPARVETIAPAVGGHRLTLDNGCELHAGLTVLADGGRSGLKASLGIDTDRHDYEQHALIANVETTHEHQGRAFERFTQEGAMALLPLMQRRMALIWTRPPEKIDATLALSDDAFLQALQSHMGARLGRFQRVGTRHVYPLSMSRAREQSRPHLAVLGNAAHAIHPVAGQGFNLALRGVMDLSAAIEAALEAGRTPGEAPTMADFEQRRQSDRDLIMQASDTLVRLFGLELPGIGGARGAALGLFNLATPLKRALIRRAMGLARH